MIKFIKNFILFSFLLFYSACTNQPNNQTLSDINSFETLETKYSQKKYDEVLSSFQKLANRGDVDSIYYLLEMYSNGYGVKKNPERSLYWFKKLQEKEKENNLDARSYYALTFINGYVVNKDTKKGVSILKILAKKNHLKSIRKMGDLYFDGKVVRYDYDKGVSYYTKAAKLNDAKAQYILGVLYLDRKALKESIKWFTLASEQNESNALVQMGYIYLYGLMGKKRDYKKAFIYFEKAKKLGNVGALNGLGSIYFHGHGVEKEYKKAYNYFIQSANLGNTLGEYNIGMMYFYGYQVKQDDLKAFEWFDKAASKMYQPAIEKVALILEQGSLINRLTMKELIEKKFNNAQRQYNIGYKYYKNKKYKEALHWLSISEDNGNILAVHDIGVMHFLGYGVKKDYEKAVTYFQKGLEHNLTSSIFVMGIMYYNGYGVEKNYKKSFELFSKAYNDKYEASGFFLADSFYYGKGTAQNKPKGMKLFKQSATKGDAKSQFALGVIHFDKKEYSQSLSWLTLASIQNHSLSFYYLGYLYENGLGTITSKNEAYELYQKGVKHNDPNSMYALAQLYLKKIVTADDYKDRAITLLKQAIKHNHILSKRELGIMYKEGKDIPYDIDKAVDLLTEASIQSEPIALNHLAKIYFYKKYNKTDIKEAHNLFMKSAQKNNEDAMYHLGLIYLNGEVINQNYKKAFEYFQNASDNEHLEARKKLAFMYEHGLGVDKDYATSIRLLQSINKNSKNTKSMYELANQNRFLQESKTLSNETLSLYEKSANKGSVEAQYTLGDIYLNGYGVEKDIDKAIKWLSKSAKQNHKASLEPLAKAYMSKKDTFSAIFWYRKLDELYNDSDAQYEIGNIYYKNKNYSMAIQWYEKAMSSQNISAINTLANMYYEGIGVNKNNKKALILYRESAILGDKKAQRLYRVVAQKVYTEKKVQKVKKDN